MISAFKSCDPTPIAEWITAIPFEDWPQQTHLEDKKIRPAMVTDLGWHGFGDVTEPLVRKIADKDYRRMLSVIMPGHVIPAHRDVQDHVTRVHVPITTNEQAKVHFGNESFHMQVGTAYLFNTEELHTIRNDGETPRIHLMFDI